MHSVMFGENVQVYLIYQRRYKHTPAFTVCMALLNVLVTDLISTLHASQKARAYAYRHPCMPLPTPCLSGRAEIIEIDEIKSPRPFTIVTGIATKSRYPTQKGLSLDPGKTVEVSRLS